MYESVDKRRKRHRLRFSRIDRIAFVDRPDNPPAVILISKRAEGAQEERMSEQAQENARVARAVAKILGKMPIVKSEDGSMPSFSEWIHRATETRAAALRKRNPQLDGPQSYVQAYRALGTLHSADGVAPGHLEAGDAVRWLGQKFPDWIADAADAITKAVDQ